MRYLFILLIACCLFTSDLDGQSEWGGVSFKALFLDYQTFNGGDFGAFKDYTTGLEFSYIHNLTDNISFELPIKMGTIDLMEEKRVRMLGADLHAMYKFREPEKQLRPYVLAGAGVVLENFDSANVQFPVGAGLDLRVAPNAYVTWQSEVRFSLADNRNNFNHSIGFKYMFGNKPEAVVLPPLDSDQDGIVDSLDKCPLVPGLPVFMGCPDTDSDGIPDMDDACPEYPGLAQFNGCPDSDGDGVPDNDDLCPNEPGPAANNGCPMNDADKDGIPDEEDDCPNVPGPAAYNGCPDTDGDGIRDIDDLCPNSPGPESNQGCPEIRQEVKEILEFAVQAVEFQHGSALLRGDAYAILDQIVEIMDEYHEYRLEISGHTDNTGRDTYNQELSEKRAKSCFDYLVEQGVSSRRLSYVGFGEDRPIADNDTREGRQLNRRVEFNLIPGLN